MTGDSNSPQRGEIWFADLGGLDPTKGAEIQKSRPVLIVGNDILNQHRRTVLVIPLATAGGNPRANPPITIEIHCAHKQGVAVIDQLRALDKQRLSHLMDVLPPSAMAPIDAALKQALSLD